MRGLPPSFSAEDFKTHFSKQFNTTDTKIIPHRRIGYVGFKTPEDATKAVKYYNKSFIRMSKIGVELARSVEELRLPRIASNPTNGEKRTHKATIDDERTHVGAKETKQRGNTHGVEDKKKLNEFLEAMQPPSKSRIWEDQTATGTQTLTDPILNVSGDYAVDEKADELYEPVPKKQKRSHEITQETNQSDRPAQFKKDLHPDITESSSPEEAEGAQRVSDPVQAESDADWIRSRTSRLLGLVDEDDDQVPIAQTDEDQMPELTKEKQPEQLTPGNTSDANAQTDHEAGEDDAIEEVIQSSEVQKEPIRNARLFLRNLTYSITEDDLRELFMGGNYGAIEEVS